MSGTSSTDRPTQPQATPNADALEVVPGATRAPIEGSIPDLSTPDALRAVLDQAFAYRGDVTITRQDGRKIEGYVFDRRTGATLEDSHVRLMPKDADGKLSISYSEIAALAFTGRDTAAGKSWEAWVRKYWEKRAAGEQGIGLDPEGLDEQPCRLTD